MTFSFLECVDMWDGYPNLRRRARSMQMFVQDTKRRKHVSPTLENMILNEPVIRPLTRVMAKHGRIQKSADLLREAVYTFYHKQTETGEVEDMVTTHKKVQVVNKSVKVMKKMLTAIKRKWSRWELPREHGLSSNIF